MRKAHGEENADRGYPLQLAGLEVTSMDGHLRYIDGHGQ